MPYKDPARRRTYERGRIKQKQAKRRALIDRLKAAPCVRCGGMFPPVCMDWHHRDSTTKAKGPRWISMALDQFHAEVAKCDLLCANCHRLLHHEARP